MMKAAGLLFFAIAVGACAPDPAGNGNGDGNGDGDGDGVDAGAGRADARPGNPPSEFPDAGPPEACEKMDILFVVDNSGSMQQEQENLAANFPMFISVLDSFVAQNGNPIDYRVAVTSTGVNKQWTQDIPIFGPTPASITGGDDGAMLKNNCSMPRRWLEKADPDVANTFGCAARLGTGGPGDEMPLEALRLAFADRMTDGTNAGFHREDALLAIVILTDENDCSRADNNFSLGFAEDLCGSATSVDTYKTFLDDYAGGAGRWAVAVIAGETDCSSEFGSADRADRLIDFANMAGDNGVLSSICEGDLSIGLQEALETFDAACMQLPPID